MRPVLTACITAGVLAGLVGPAEVASATPTPPPTPKVIGGHNATEPYSFAASLQDLKGNHFCGAALIRPRWLVTARHCVVNAEPGLVQARIGSLNRTSGGMVKRITRLIVAPESDAAVVKLADSVPYVPIKIASRTPVGSPLRLLGWGVTKDPDGTSPKTLQELDTTIRPDKQCKTGARELCVGNVDGWRGACYGDSGGPAILKAAGVWQLAGTTSRGTTEVCGEGPSIYADAAWHKSWIESIVGKTG